MFKKPSSPKKLEDLGNMPPALVETPERKFSELYGSAQVHGARWFVAFCLSLVVIIVLVITMSTMASGVKVVPYMVKVDADSGRLVGKPVAAEEFKQVAVEQKIIAAEVRAWVRDLMALDPFLTANNLQKAARRTTGKAGSEFSEYLAKEKPHERLAKTEGLVRTVDPIVVDASQKNIAFVFAQTNERVSNGAPIVHKWRFVIHYVIDPAIDPQGLTDNPLGFVVTHFERIQEVN